jgi:hypothetical protein
MPRMEILFNPKVHNVYMSDTDNEIYLNDDLINSKSIDENIDDIINYIENPICSKIQTFIQTCDIIYHIDISTNKIYMENNRGSVIEFSILEHSDPPMDENANMEVIWYKGLPNGSVIWGVEWV